MKVLIIAAALCGLALSALGAVGAHLVGSSEAATAASGGWHQFNANAWNSAMLYGFAHALAALLATALPARRTIAAAAGWAFILGIMLFSFSIMAKEILLVLFVPDADPAGAMQLYDRITIVTPAGGVAFMVGWMLLMAAALMKQQDSQPRA
jgi:uncharacterized membrane protein YgdD (TMEM256/DUF423 family)